MISMRKLARLAGVSRTTVSRALHNDPCVHPETRKRIQALADQHHYLRNVLTQGILTGRTRMIGLILPSLHDNVYSAFLQGALNEAKVHGYHVNVAEGHQTIEQLRAIIDRFVELRADGIICRPGAPVPLPRDLLLKAYSYRTAVVGVDLYDTDFPMDQLSCAEDTCAEKILDYLVGLGHRTFAFVGPIGKDHLRGRARSIQAALKRLRLSTELFIEVPSGLLDVERARTILTDLLSRPKPPTAIIGWDDTVSCRLVQQALELRIAIPQHLSIIGNGNSPLAEVTSPPLTTLELDFEQRGHDAVRLVVARCQQNAPPFENICTSPRLIKRGSCASPPFR